MTEVGITELIVFLRPDQPVVREGTGLGDVSTVGEVAELLRAAIVNKVRRSFGIAQHHANHVAAVEVVITARRVPVYIDNVGHGIEIVHPCACYTASRSVGK